MRAGAPRRHTRAVWSQLAVESPRASSETHVTKPQCSSRRSVTRHVSSDHRRTPPAAPAMSPPPHATSTPRIEMAQTGDAPGSSIGSEHSFAPSSSANTRIVASWQPPAARSPSTATDHTYVSQSSERRSSPLPASHTPA